MTKAEIIKAIEALPEDATVEDVMDRLYFLSRLQEAVAQADAGDTMDHDEFFKQAEQWGK